LPPRLFDRSRNTFPLRQISRDTGGAPSSLLDLRYSLVNRFLTASQNRNCHAFCGQRLRHTASQSFAAAEYQRCFSRKA
jgi:hypothetical protein